MTTLWTSVQSVHVVRFAGGRSLFHARLFLGVVEGEGGEVVRVAPVAWTQTHVTIVGHVLKTAVLQQPTRKVKGLTTPTEHRCAHTGKKAVSLENVDPKVITYTSKKKWLTLALPYTL